MIIRGGGHATDARLDSARLSLRVRIRLFRTRPRADSNSEERTLTPIGHWATGYLAGRASRPLAPVAAAVAVGSLLPDVDYLLIGFEFFNAIHRSATHNVFFIGLVAATGFLIPRGGGWKIAGALALGGALHLAIDSALDNNPTNGLGVALLWPITDHHFSPFNLMTARDDLAGWSDPISMARATWPLLLFEAPIAGAAFWMILRSRRARTGFESGSADDRSPRSAD